MKDPIDTAAMICSGSDSWPYTTAILAGGEARRLGGIDKGMADLLGRPLIEWVIEAVPAPARRRLLIVANRNRDGYARYADVVSDATPDFRGPLAGVAAALGASRSPWLLTVPVDCPRPPAGLHEHLWAQLDRNSHVAVVARDTRRRQPLFALYSASLAQSAREAARAGLGVSRWQDAIGAVEVEFHGIGAAWSNLNSEADFREFSDQYERHD